MSGMDRLTDEELERMDRYYFSPYNTTGNMARELLAHRRASQAAPAQPTEAMLNAARDWSDAKYGKPIGNDAAIGCWNAMLAAAPAPVGFGMYGEYTPITVGAGTTFKTPAPSDGLLEAAIADALNSLDGEPEYHENGMGCGLEDRNITDRYEAMAYGWDQAMERIFAEHINPAIEALTSGPAQEGEPRHD